MNKQMLSRLELKEQLYLSGRRGWKLENITWGISLDTPQF